MPDGRRRQLAVSELVAPGDDVRPGDGAKFLGPLDAREPNKILERGLVRSAGRRSPEVSKPLELRGHVGQALERGGGKVPGDRRT